MGRSTPPRGPHDLLAVATRLDQTVTELRGVRACLVVEAHDRGATWEEVGAAFEVTAQAVHDARAERQGASAR